MKKRGIFIVIVTVVAVVLGVWLLTRPSPLGNIVRAYSEPETTTASISFSGEAGDRIKFSFRAGIESGSLDFVLYDSAGYAIYELDRGTELETFFDLSSSDTYTLAAECKSLVGKYDVSVYKVK